MSANDGSLIPSSVKNSFEAKYGKTINVTWEKVQSVYVGRFSEEETDFEVYYSDDVELPATGHYSYPAYLPLLISDALSTRFPGLVITQSLELSSETMGTSYFIRMSNSKMQLDIRSYSDGTTEVLTKTKVRDLGRSESCF